jgi:hypothetical protein
MAKKREIDWEREGAFTVELCDPDDKTPIRKMLSNSQNLYVITDKSIFLNRLADDIDPQRTNKNIPNTHEKFLNYGFENDLVGRILLLAEALFDEKHLGRDFKCNEAIANSIEATKLLLEMQEIHALLLSDENSIIERGLLPDVGRSQNIPTVKDLETRVENYIRKADRVRYLIIEIFKLAYSAGNNRKTLENLKDSIAEKHGKESEFVDFLDEITYCLKFLRNLRNGYEHPNQKERTIILDFSLTLEATVDPPMIELIHPDTPQPKTPVTALMEQVGTQLVDIFETIIFQMCQNNMDNFGGFECGIMEIPSERRRHKDTKFGYAIRLNNQWNPLG